MILLLTFISATFHGILLYHLKNCMSKSFDIGETIIDDKSQMKCPINFCNQEIFSMMNCLINLCNWFTLQTWAVNIVIDEMSNQRMYPRNIFNDEMSNQFMQVIHFANMGNNVMETRLKTLAVFISRIHALWLPAKKLQRNHSLFLHYNCHL